MKLNSQKPSNGRPTSGIARQLLRVFVLQMLFISGITVLGVYAAAKIVEGVMMRAALEGEAKHFWHLLESNPDQFLPDTDNLTGFLARQGDLSSVPEELQQMDVGYRRAVLDQRNPLVFVQDKNGDRLFLVFDEENVSRLSFFFGVVPLSLALIVLYISAWFAYGQSRKAVSPLVQLAKTMRQFNIETQGLDQLNLKELQTRPGNDEVNVLVDALNGFTGEINQLIERERRFTRDASHELRTPLTVIQGSAEWLKKNTSADDQQSKNLDRILRTTGDMDQLVTALLLLARGANKELNSEPTSINYLIEKLVSELEITHNADQHVTIDIVGNPDLVVTASPQGLTMVLGNILRNAYNYTHQGLINVEVKSASVRITNQGDGVEVKDVPSLFEPFVRGADQASTGYGVGLDIVKRLCDHFNWQIDARYLPHLGMTFEVIFDAEK